MSWDKQYSLGEKGEQIVKQYLIAKGHDVIDITKDSRYYTSDIDFIVDRKTVELKTDTIIWRTNNLFIEDEKYFYDGGYYKQGWLHYTKAEYLLYFDINKRILYKYKMQDVKDYIQQNKKRIAKKACNDDNKKVWGYCVNKDAIPHETAQL